MIELNKKEIEILNAYEYDLNILKQKINHLHHAHQNMVTIILSREGIEDIPEGLKRDGNKLIWDEPEP